MQRVALAFILRGCFLRIVFDNFPKLQCCPNFRSRQDEQCTRICRYAIKVATFNCTKFVEWMKYIFLIVVNQIYAFIHTFF